MTRGRQQTSGGACLLGLECIVRASMVQIMTQTAHHQCQHLSIGQEVLESGCLSKRKSTKIMFLSVIIANDNK